MREFHEALLEMLDSGRAAASATIVKASGSTPREVGARMIVPDEGEPLFTLGGGAFEAEVIRDAREAMRGRTPVLKTYSLAARGREGEGQECGGSVTVFIEPVVSAEKLWIFGGGHVARALAAASGGLGFDVTVYEDREELADSARLPGARRVIRTDVEYRENVPAPDEGARCVVLTRSHRTDRAALRAALSGSAVWVGMIGSARKRLAIFRELQEEDGIPAERLEAVECPVGLPIGAETPEEIAISILARLIEIRRQKRG